MKIRNIALDADEVPETISVDMSVREAALIVRLIGSHSDTQLADTQAGGPATAGEIYGALTGAFFNRFWEDGVSGVPR